MANVAKLVELIFGANPSQDDLRVIIERINERLPKPIVEAAIAPDSEAPDEPAAKTSKAKSK